METLSIRNVANASVFRQLLMSQQTGWNNKPSDWSDIRKDCPADSIALYAGVKSDYSAYDNLGFTATISNSGQYKVYIDETLYGTYNSGAQCSITWSTSGITTGDDITTPSALKAHKIWIEPATAGNNITKFQCQRIAASGNESQGILWEHFNLINSVDISDLNANGSFGSSDYSNPSLIACTAKNNELNFTGIQRVFFRCEKLTYVPVLNCTYTSWLNASNMFANCYLLENITIKNLIIGDGSYSFHNCRKLEKVSGNIDYSQASLLRYHYSNNNSLKDMVLDLSSSNSLKVVGCLGSSSYFMSGFKGLRVSSSAPFDYATAPQINVSYTGMDRAALVQLFNDLPFLNKLYAFTDGNGNTIYSTDILLTNNSKLYNSQMAYIGTPSSINNTNNLSIQGSLNENNYEYNGFSSSNYLITPTFTPSTAPWTIVLKAKFSNSGLVGFCGTQSQRAWNLYWNDGGVNLELSSNQSYYDIGSIMHSTPITTDNETWYYLKFEYTGTKYIYSVKEESEANYTEQGSITSSTPIYTQYAPVPLTLGIDIGGSAMPAATIDGKGTYFEDSNGLTRMVYTSSLSFDNTTYTRDSSKDISKTNIGQIINITGCTGNSNLEEEDIDIATSKGWSVTGGPIFTQAYAYRDSNDNIVYTTDKNPTTSSTFYNSQIQSIGTPSSITTNLKNASVVGTLTNTDGVFSGFSASNYISTTNKLRFNTKAVLYIKAKPIDKNNYAEQTLITSINPTKALYAEKYAYGKYLAFDNAGTTYNTGTLANDAYQYFAIEAFADGGITYRAAYSEVSGIDVDSVPAFSDSSFWYATGYISDVNFNDIYLYLGMNPSDETGNAYWESDIDLNNTKFIIDDTTEVRFTYKNIVINSVSYTRDESEDKKIVIS